MGEKHIEYLKSRYVLGIIEVEELERALEIELQHPTPEPYNPSFVWADSVLKEVYNRPEFNAVDKLT